MSIKAYSTQPPVRTYDFGNNTPGLSKSITVPANTGWKLRFLQIDVTNGTTGLILLTATAPAVEGTAGVSYYHQTPAVQAFSTPDFVMNIHFGVGVFDADNQIFFPETPIFPAGTILDITSVSAGGTTELNDVTLTYEEYLI